MAVIDWMKITKFLIAHQLIKIFHILVSFRCSGGMLLDKIKVKAT